MKTLLRASLSTSLTLFVFAAAGAALLAGTYSLTHPTIEKTERLAKQKLIAQTLPEGGFDNDLVSEARTLPPDPQLGLRQPGELYVARLQGRPVAVVLEAIAPDGYAGEIRMLIGIHADGRIAGVRITGHRETPGLGDYIEFAKSAWVRQFEGKSATDPDAERWFVRKDGGAFDYMSGATITPRAVVKAVKKSLDYFGAHRDALLAAHADNTNDTDSAGQPRSTPEAH